jgi:cell division protein FtsI (penicillin-binding protein 3)
MEVKKDILWRVYLCYLGMIALAAVIVVKMFFIQQVDGGYWRNMADSLHDRYVTIDAERGTIYSADGRMLSTSIPYFDIHMDFLADGLREHHGRKFTENVDSLAYCLAKLFQDKSKSAYKRILERGYRKEARYFLLKKNLSFEQYARLRDFPLFRLGRNNSGMIVEQKEKRINPFGLLANRTIGLWRDNAPNIGLEATYNQYLKGVDGKRLMRRIAGGTYVPLEGYQIDPENGKDIITNLNVNIQDIAESALYNEMVSNEATHGTCIVMEVKTGKIRAIANLGRQPDGSYAEDFNYGVGYATEPGSVFKLATMISLLDDHDLTIGDHVDMGNGTYRYGNRMMRDAESHKQGVVTVAEAFEMSSNVGVSKLAYKYYQNDPEKYIAHLKKLRLNKKSGIDLLGEAKPLVKSPQNKTWSSTTLPWMSIGYEVLETPLNILTLYNAVANNGKMMKPYLVSSVEQYGQVIRQFEPTVLIDKVCSDKTLLQLHAILDGVVSSEYGTGHRALDNPYFKIAGKTGTALMANGSHGYADHIYQATFVGYFPADNPVYSCIVTIKNKPNAAHIYGASVAAPVFGEVANRLYAMTFQKDIPAQPRPVFDSTLQIKSGRADELNRILARLHLPVSGTGAARGPYVDPAVSGQTVSLKPVTTAQGAVPDVRGMGLKDALYLLESAGLKVKIQGKGRVVSQSLRPGQPIGKDGNIAIQLS